MSVPLFLVDAFADSPFAGNPAAVCLLDGPADPVWMQAVAAELQQPATGFVHPVQRPEHPAPAAPGAAYDVVSRFFAPDFGLNEDSVTGSAHCALGPYWGERLGRTRLRAYQASARGGLVRVDLDGERVLLAGSAVTVLRGALLAPSA